MAEKFASYAILRSWNGEINDAHQD